MSFGSGWVVVWLLGTGALFGYMFGGVDPVSTHSKPDAWLRASGFDSSISRFMVNMCCQLYQCRYRHESPGLKWKRT